MVGFVTCRKVVFAFELGTEVQQGHKIIKERLQGINVMIYNKLSVVIFTLPIFCSLEQ